MNLISSETTTTQFSGFRDSRDSLCYTLLMTANKPETAVQGCTFFLWGHTHFCSCTCESESLWCVNFCMFSNFLVKKNCNKHSFANFYTRLGQVLFETLANSVYEQPLWRRNELPKKFINPRHTCQEGYCARLVCLLSTCLSVCLCVCLC